MKKTLRINREDIVAIINNKNLSLDNREYMTDIIKQNKIVGDVDHETIIISENEWYMVKPSSKQIMKKLNNSLFLNLKEDN